MPTTKRIRKARERMSKADREAAEREEFVKFIDHFRRKFADGIITEGFKSIEGNLMMACHAYAHLLGRRTKP